MGVGAGTHLTNQLVSFITRATESMFHKTLSKRRPSSCTLNFKAKKPKRLGGETGRDHIQHPQSLG